MIRFFSLLTMTLLFAQVAWSRHLSPDEALGRLNDKKSMSKIVSNQSGHSSRHELVRSVNAPGSEEAAIYLFSDNAQRFVVLPADDKAPALLGYFDRQGNGHDAKAMPPAFEWWLEQYAAQIQYARSNPGSMAAAPAADRAPIDYLVKTRWNQSYPYNAQCPTFGDQQAVTGCVATAFAQVMNYHRWPEQGRGSASCTGGTMDFSEVTFDWDSMLDEYDYEADRNSPEVEAVSTLMKACGYSVRMEYGVNWSGAYTGYIVDAAPEFFDYADEMYYAERRNYTSAQWEDLVYGQLAQGLPLIYSGRDGNWSDSSGHCFICDGYDGEGYYHFNWGWGGDYDGWFLLSALVPEGVGIGGVAGGYDYSQSLVVNFHPSCTTIEASQGYISYSIKFNSNKKEVYVDVYPERLSLAPEEMNFGLEFLSDGDRALVVDIGNVPLKNDIYRLSYVLSYDTLSGLGLADGSYEVRFVYKNSDDWQTMMCQYRREPSLRVDFSAADIIISNIEKVCPVTISNVKFNGYDFIVKGSSNELTYTATNNSNEAIHWMSSLGLGEVGYENLASELTYGNFDLAPGETRTFSVPLSAYDVRALNVDTDYYFMFKGGEESCYITVYADQDVTFSVVDPAVNGVSDGTFRYLDLADGELMITGLDSSASKLSGDVVLPDQIEIDGVSHKVVSMTATFSDLIDMNQVTSIDIRTPIKSIPAQAFYNCESLQSISFPQSLESIGTQAFTYCKNLGGELKLPESLVSIGTEAFEGCYSLTGSLNIPASVKYIGMAAFFNLVGLDGTLSLPQSLTSIEDYAFAYCYYLTGPLEIPSSVTSIGYCAFRQSGFTGSLVIPEGVRSIGNIAFSDCDGLTDVTMLPEKVPALGSDVFPSLTFYVAAGAGDAYRTALSEYSDDVYELGDANLSKSLTVADAVAVVNEIIGAPNASFDSTCGDINRDGRISISDATMVVSCVLKYNPGGMAGSPAAKVSAPVGGRLAVNYSGQEGMALSVADAGDIVALQADIIPTAGVKVGDIRLSEALKDTHTLQTARLADGTLRMIVFSMSNSKMDLNGSPFAFVEINGQDEALQIENIIAVSADATEFSLGYEGSTGVGLSCGDLASAKACVSVSGGMLSVSNAAGVLVKVYDLSGRLIMSFMPDSDSCTRQLDKGIYMVSVNDREAVKIIL